MGHLKHPPSWNEWLVDHLWIVETAAILLVLFLLNLFLKKAVLFSRQKAHLKETDWRSHLDSAVALPARIFIWILFLGFAMDLVGRELEIQDAFSFIRPLRSTGIIICSAWFLLRWKKVFHNSMAVHRVKGKLSFDPVSLEILSKLFTMGVLFVALLLILGIYGLNIVPLITFGGIGAAAIGFASKDVIANFFGGLMLYVTRPFILNDLIELPERKILGNIEEIGWYLTSIRDVQKRPIYIPNALFSKESLVNHSRMTHRRIEETIGIRYTDTSRVDAIVDKIRELLKSRPDIDDHLPIDVFFRSFGSSSLKIEISAYTLATRYEEFVKIKQQILLSVHEIVLLSGAEMQTAPLEALFI